MKRLQLNVEESRTLREMGIHHPYARTRMRAQGVLRLSQGLTLQQVADEFGVHLNSVEKWKQRWHAMGLVGLFEGHHSGRPPTLSIPDQIAERAHPVPCIVVLDNAGIHKGEVMQERRRQWQQKGLHLYYLPPYSPELNRIEILWKQAKYFWRKFVRLTGDDLIEEVRSIMKNYGTKFTINFG